MDKIKGVFNNTVGKKGGYGIFIFIICGMTIFFVMFLTYFAQKVNVDVRYAAFIIFVCIILPIVLIFKFWGQINVLLTFDEGKYITLANFGASLGFLIVLGIIFGILIGTAKDDSNDSSVFSKTADYSIMNKYILSSVGLWFAMLLTILLCSKIRGNGGIVKDSVGGTILIAVFIVCIIAGSFLNTTNIAGSFLNTTNEMNVYVVGDIVEVNDAGNNG